MNLRFWHKDKPETKTQLEVVRRDASKLRLAEFRQDEKSVAMARALAQTESFQLVLDVLRNESPANTILPLDATTEIRSAHQARTEGYKLALAIIEAMTVPDVQPEPLEATFEPEEQPQTA